MIRKHSTLLALILALGLLAAACAGGAAPTTQAPTATTAAPATTAVEETTTTAAAMIGEGRTVGLAYDVGGRGDKSFNDLAAAAVEQAQAEYGITFEELTPTAGGENREENLRLLSEAGQEWILANGFAFAENVGNVAPEFPDTRYAITDACPTENFVDIELDNVACLRFTEEEGSFLMGTVAALKSETGTIGFIGGVETPLILKFQAGFEAGVAHIDPEAEVIVQYLTVAPDFTGFNDPAKGKEAALAMYQQGADIIYHAAGGSGTGMFEAAKEVSESTGSKVWGIGVDADQYNTVGAELQEWVLTSMLKRVDVAVFDAITAWLQDAFGPGDNVFDLASDGVNYSTTGGFIDDIVPQIDEIKQQIIDGEIEVPTEP